VHASYWTFDFRQALCEHRDTAVRDDNMVLALTQMSPCNLRRAGRRTVVTRTPAPQRADVMPRARKYMEFNTRAPHLQESCATWCCQIIGTQLPRASAQERLRRVALTDHSYAMYVPCSPCTYVCVRPSHYKKGSCHDVASVCSLLRHISHDVIHSARKTGRADPAR
jgi:hypothetical protein